MYQFINAICISTVPTSSKVASTIIGHKENKNQQISIGIEGSLNDYFKGDNFMRSKKWNEHESYNKAKGDMEKIHHEKIAKVSWLFCNLAALKHNVNCP